VNKTMAVVLGGMIHHTTRDCYKAKGVISLEGSNYGFGDDFYDTHAPTMWGPGFPEYHAAERALVRSLKRRGWFGTDKTVGVAFWDDPPYRDILNKTLKPELAKAGITTVVEGAVSNDSINEIETGLGNAIATFQSRQVKRVLFIGSAPLAPFFWTDAAPAGAKFIYGLTSFDNPLYAADNFGANSKNKNGFDLMTGMMGVGFTPVEDVHDEQVRFPRAGLEAQCVQIYKAAGIVIPARITRAKATGFSSKQSMAYCENTLFLKSVADRVTGPLTPASFAAKANGLGSGWQSASAFHTSFGPSKHAGTDAYREFAYDAAATCDSALGCNKYVSGNLAL
jgi:hypothetical protein